jgi:hypothetical protein
MDLELWHQVCAFDSQRRPLAIAVASLTWSETDTDAGRT